MRVTSACAGAALLREHKRGNVWCVKRLPAPLVVWTGSESRYYAASPGRRRATPKNKTQRHLPMVVVRRMYATW